MSDTAETLEDLQRKLARAAARRNWEGLAAHVERLRAAYPDAWEADYYEARALVEQGRYEQAEHQLLLAMDHFPRASALPTLFGESGVRRLSKAACIARWQTLLTRLPDEPNMYVGLADALAAAGQPDDAAQTLQHGVERLPASVELREAIARGAWQKKEWEPALEAWTEVHRLSPTHPTASIFMIRALTRLQRLDEADALALAEMQQRPQDVELAVSYAGLAQQAGDGAEAVRRWRKVHEMAPAYPFGALGLAQALAGQQAFAEADSVLEAGLKHNPKQQALLTEYATNATRRNEPAIAVARYKAAYEGGRMSAPLYLEYIQALERTEQFNEADEIAAEAVGFAPDHLGLARRYAALATLRADHAEALRRWQEAAVRFPNEEAVQAGMKRSAKAVERQENQRRRDREADSLRTPKSSIPAPPSIPTGRIINTGPTALDRLMAAGTPAPQALPAPPPSSAPGGTTALDQLKAPPLVDPAPTGLRQRLKRLLGGG